jgi:hypothetical protein
MNSFDPLNISVECSAEEKEKVEELHDLYTKEGAPKSFKKVFKYGSIYNWALQYTDLIKQSHLVHNAECELKEFRS